MPEFSCGHKPWMLTSCVECRPDMFRNEKPARPDLYPSHVGVACCSSCVTLREELKIYKESYEQQLILKEGKSEANDSLREEVRVLRSCLSKTMKVVDMAVESQGWDGNDPDDDRWSEFYRLAKTCQREES